MLQRAISGAEKQHRDKVESNYQGFNTRNMGSGLRAIIDYKRKASSAEICLHLSQMN